MFRAGLFTIVPNWKQPRCLSVGEWINVLWYIHAIQRKGMNYSCIRQHGVPQKNTDCMIKFVWDSGTGKPKC